MDSSHSSPAARRRFPRVEDVAWFVLFGAMALVSPEGRPGELAMLASLAAVQILEPRLEAFRSLRGNTASILIKLLLGLILIQATGGVNSPYYMILLLPVATAASTRQAGSTVFFTLLASAAYLSLLLLVDWSRYTIGPYDLRRLALRLIFIALVGYLAHRLAEATRLQARKYQEAAEQLAGANRSLQEAEAAVRRSERLAALGQLSAGLAHELRNPLGTMRASAEMLQKSLPEGSDVARELAGYISAEVERTDSLITRFLDFARPLKLRPGTAELGEVIDRAVSQLERHRPALPVTVYKNYSPDIRPFAFDGELMERVFYNLLLNAAQASPAGAAVTVKTRPLDGMVEVAVIDRGKGIAPGQMESIFNPFYTTRPDGVGLGLAIVSKIVDEHGGRVTVESEQGRGSVFRVFLPAQAEPREG